MVSLNINGKTYQADVDPRTPAALGAARHDRPDRHQIRLRHRPVRRLHGAYRRRRDALLPGAGQLGRGQARSRRSRASRENGVLHKVQQAWIDHDVPQCGYCQSGMIMAVAALLKDNPKPTDDDIDGAITNICRCGTYQQVREAIHAAAKA